MHNSQPPEEIYKNPQEYKHRRQESYAQNSSKEPPIHRSVKNDNFKSPTILSNKSSRNGYYQQQPTLPYYVVPVLYVPKRVLPNEEMQPPAYKPPGRYQEYYNEEFDYQPVRNLYDYEESKETEIAVEDNLDDYYNAQYSNSNDSIKIEQNIVEAGYSYTPEVDHINTQHICKSCDSRKMKSKTRSYINTNPYNPEEPYQYTYYNHPSSYQKSTHLDISTAFKTTTNEDVDIEEDVQELTMNKGTQTNESKVYVITISTQTDFKDKIRGTISNGQVTTQTEDDEPKPVIKKTPILTHQHIEPRRMDSPVRRRRK